ncbi:TonB-dependent receptor [Elizabethkingia anophelis]|uniref:TonB-dependent receptor n=1 Tax=Elizabethkingia anophelis TaxID=1117645 RepID=UPI00200D0B76|nr:TonB-dependent receptor plug domain-containing protein [Elizabethkingia anophelis]MCL1033760.1 TonB-dependent receptor [Elizabethkingia anophelis]MCW2464667.1 outer membrane cobalamin receptor [Elizabethkingia anophelis]MCW2468350.1 outer membrane cobalamin receptor [Elizabethkingia anophelis]MCW2472034.1 outer membrane cobalamin receptor [Elizabethkingia anophelis]HBI9691794.1 TonB-dependent receptor [Elizabethkingia anophelis]
MNINFKKPLITALVLSTASVYYAQKTKDSLEKSKSIDEVVLVGRNLTQVAKERKTPVAVSTIKATEIQEKLGNREFPEIMKSTPSVYVTKVGGGFGDSRINMRGFDATNIAVIINGQPVNDMQNGAVYWSNWTGLADIASSIQIQRGLGASKFVVPSVGGTINIVTKATDSEQKAMIKAEAGNDSYSRLSAMYSSGLKNKWGTTVLLSRWQGDGYINGTKGEGYSWFFSVGYKPNEKHAFNIIATGAPQVHDTRRSSATGANVATLRQLDTYGRRYNPQTGMLNGSQFNLAPNFYHKPIASLNWDWTINDALKLSTVVYASWGRGGGGTGLSGSILGGADGKTPMNFTNGSGTIDWDMIYRYNRGGMVTDYSGRSFQKGTFTAEPGQPTDYNGRYVATLNGTSGIVRKQSINAHDWYGAIADLNYKKNNWTFNGGIDLKTYKGALYDIVTDMLGSDAFFVKRTVNSPNGYFVNKIVKPEAITNLNNVQKVSIYNEGLVRWAGAYGMVEYSDEKLSASLQGSVSKQYYKRRDYMLYTPENQETEWYNKTGYIVKGGANYNIDEHHNVFFNTGVISRQPQFNALFPSNQNVYKDAKNERIFSIELGYGFKSRYVDVNINAYRTQWDDRFITRTFNATAGDVANFSQLQLGNSYFYNALNVGQLHQGVELEAKARPFANLKLRGMLSVGNWKYKGDASFNIIDVLSNQEVPGATGTINIKDLKVGDAAQTTASIGADYNITKAFSIDANWEYYDKLYAQFNPINFLTAAARDKGVVKLPSYNLFDVGAAYKFTIDQKRSLTLRVNVYNLFNKYYISELSSNIYTTDKIANGPDAGKTYQEAGRVYQGVADGNTGFLGFGRTWSAAATFRF